MGAFWDPIDENNKACLADSVVVALNYQFREMLYVSGDATGSFAEKKVVAGGVFISSNISILATLTKLF